MASMWFFLVAAVMLLLVPRGASLVFRSISPRSSRHLVHRSFSSKSFDENINFKSLKTLLGKVEELSAFETEYLATFWCPTLNCFKLYPNIESNRISITSTCISLSTILANPKMWAEYCQWDSYRINNIEDMYSGAPMKDGLASLAADEVNELCKFLQISTLAELTNEGSTGRYCDRIVDILEGLWVVQGIKEKQYHAWKNELKESNQQEYYNITNTSANEIEQNKLLHKLSIEYEVQMEILCALINRTSYKLLMDQVRTLIQLSFPSINSNIVEKIELSISKSINSNNVNEFDQQLVAEISNISRRVTAILSTRIKSNSDYYSFEEKQKRRKQRK